MRAHHRSAGGRKRAFTLRAIVGLTSSHSAVARPRVRAGKAARRLANGGTPCILEGKRGFSPGRGNRPAISCDEELGGEFTQICVAGSADLSTSSPRLTKRLRPLSAENNGFCECCCAQYLPCGQSAEDARRNHRN